MFNSDELNRRIAASEAAGNLRKELERRNAPKKKRTPTITDILLGSGTTGTSHLSPESGIKRGSLAKDASKDPSRIEWAMAQIDKRGYSPEDREVIKSYLWARADEASAGGGGNGPFKKILATDGRLTDRDAMVNYTMGYRERRRQNSPAAPRDPGHVPTGELAAPAPKPVEPTLLQKLSDFMSVTSHVKNNAEKLAGSLYGVPDFKSSPDGEGGQALAAGEGIGRTLDYAVPFAGAIKGGADLANLATQAVQDPAGTGKGLLDSVNPVAAYEDLQKGNWGDAVARAANIAATAFGVVHGAKAIRGKLSARALAADASYKPPTNMTEALLRPVKGEPDVSPTPTASVVEPAVPVATVKPEPVLVPTKRPVVQPGVLAQQVEKVQAASKPKAVAKPVEPVVQVETPKVAPKEATPEPLTGSAATAKALEDAGAEWMAAKKAAPKGMKNKQSGAVNLASPEQVQAAIKYAKAWVAHTGTKTWEAFEVHLKEIGETARGWKSVFTHAVNGTEPSILKTADGGTVPPKVTTPGLEIADPKKPMGKANSLQAGVRYFTGSAQDIIRSEGPVGKDIADGLARVMSDQSRASTELQTRLHDSVKKQYGWQANYTKEGRTTLGRGETGVNDIVSKVLAGKDLNPKEKVLWDTVSSISKDIREQAIEAGVKTGRTFDGTVPDKAIGEKITFMQDGKPVDGVIAGYDKGKLQIDMNGKDVELSIGDPYWSAQWADDATFFPEQLKDGVLEDMANPDSKNYQKTAAWLVDSKKAKDLNAAHAMIKRMNEGSVSVNVGTNTRLRKPRTGKMFPPEFYNRNLLEVFDRHIHDSTMDIALAKQWGADRSGLATHLAKIPQAADGLNSIINRVTTHADSASGTVVGKGGTTWSRREGVLTAARLLTGIFTPLNNLTQAGSTLGLGGYGNSVKALAKVLTDPAARESLRLSGATEPKLLALQGYIDISKTAQAALKGPLIFQQKLDLMMRTHAAVTGMEWADSAIKGLKVVDGKIVRNAHYRDLSNHFRFTDADIVRMQKSGMNKSDIDMAIHGGVQLQVSTRADELPYRPMETPFARIAYRLQTFNIGQAKLFQGALNEAKAGNPVPLVRTLIAAAIVTEGVDAVRDHIKEMVLHEEKDKKAGHTLMEAIRKGDLPMGIEASYTNLLDGGITGLWGYPVQASRKGFDAIQTPPLVSGLNDAKNAWMYGGKSIEADGYRLGTQKGFLDFITKEVVLAKQAYKMFNNGKTFREMNPSPKAERDTGKLPTPPKPDRPPRPPKP